MTAGREDGTAGALGRLRTSHADREQAVDVLKAAFVQGRLTKDEFDLRVGQVFASRTYADLDALTADIPDGVTSAEPPAGHAREPGRMLSFKTAARVGAVGASPSMASAAVVLVQSRSACGCRRATRGPDGLGRGRAAGHAADAPVLGRAPLAERVRAGTAIGSGRPGIQAPGAGPAAAAGEARPMACGRSGPGPPASHTG